MVLTPSRSTSVCAGDDVMVKCAESGDVQGIRWTITLADTCFPLVELITIAFEGRNNASWSEAGVLFHAGLTSESPLTSMLTMITATLALDGAWVICFSGLSLDVLTIRVITNGSSSPFKIIIVSDITFN